MQEKDGSQDLKMHWRRVNDGSNNALAAGALQGSVKTAGQAIRMQTMLTNLNHSSTCRWSRFWCSRYTHQFFNPRSFVDPVLSLSETESVTPKKENKYSCH